MKRLFLLSVAVVLLGGKSIASNNLDNTEYSVFVKLSDEKNLEGLAKYLETSLSQKGYMKEIFMLSAQRMEKEAARQSGEAGIEKAVVFNLANIRSVLSDEQYKKYLTVLNVTLNNTKDDQVLTEK